MSFSPSDTRLARYRIERPLGKGAHAEVFLATDLELERPVALKLIDLAGAHGGQSDEVRARFEREAKLTARLQHPNIVVVHEFGETRDKLFLAMEYVAGGTLANRLTAGAPPLPVGEKLAIAVEIADAIAHAHERGVLHRDLKPANILLTASGHAKVTDFGIGRLLDGDVDLTATGEVVGSPAYMSPEQTRGDRVDARSDIFGLGVVLYHLLTGRKAFESRSLPVLINQIQNDTPPDPRTIDPGLPEGTGAVLLQCLAKDKSARYSDAQSVADDFRALLLSVASEAAHDSSSQKLRRLLSDTAVKRMKGELVLDSEESTAELPRVAPVPPPLPEAVEASEPSRTAPRPRRRVPLPVVAAGLVILSALAFRLGRDAIRKSAPSPTLPTPTAVPLPTRPPAPPPTAVPDPAPSPADATSEAGVAFLAMLHETWPAAPAAATHAQARSALRLHVVPPGAHVFLDGKYVGVADDWSGSRPGALLAFRRAWRHVVRVVHPGYGDLEIDLVITPGARQEVAVVAETLGAGASSAPEGLPRNVPPPDLSTSGALRLAVSPGNARVLVDGTEAGSAADYEKKDLLLDGPAVHTITLSAEGEDDAEVRVLVSPAVRTPRAVLRRKL